MSTGDADVLGMFLAPGPWALVTIKNKSEDSLNGLKEYVLDIADTDGTLRDKLEQRKKKGFSISSDLKALADLGIIMNGQETAIERWISKYDRENSRYDDDNDRGRSRPGDQLNQIDSKDLLKRMQVLFYGKTITEEKRDFKEILKEQKDNDELTADQKIEALMNILINLSDKKDELKNSAEEALDSLTAVYDSLNKRFDYVSKLFDDLSNSNDLESLKEKINGIEESQEANGFKEKFNEIIASLEKEQINLRKTEELENLAKFEKAKKEFGEQNLDQDKIKNIQINPEELDDSSKKMVLDQAKKQIDELKNKSINELKTKYSNVLSGEGDKDAKDIPNNSMIFSDDVIKVISDVKPEFARIAALIKEKFNS